MRPFSLTHVEYEDHDKLGWFMALCSLAPIFIMVSYANWLVRNRDLHTIVLLAGQLLNEVINFVCKHTIREERPFTLYPHAPKYGMPSNHAQFMGFWSSYLVLWCLLKWGFPSRLFRATVAVFTVALAAAVCLSRVYLGYHTLIQVAVGYAVGILTGLIWFRVVETVLRAKFESWSRSGWCRFLMITDMSHCPDIMTAEYMQVCAATSKGNSKQK